MMTFLITLAAMWYYGFRGHRRVTDIERLGVEAHIENPLFATVVVGWFLGTVIAMSMREHIGVQLGFIALTGAVISLVLVLELLGDRVKAPSFEDVLQELDWRAIFFYIALFALVGGLEKSHILDKLADALRPIFSRELCAGRDAALLGHRADRRVSSSTTPTSSPSSTRSRTWRRRNRSLGRCSGCCCGPARSAATSPSPARRHCTWR